MQQDERPISLKISIAARMLTKRFDHRAKKIGVTAAQWRTIAAVKRLEGATQRRIAAMLEVGDVTAGRLIDRLCADGWVERRPDPEDRRAHRIFMTPAARPVLERLGALGADEEARAFRGISPDDLVKFDDVLGRIMANLATSADAVPREEEALI
jgi:DNA-binding MarR family transcriptional regulator